MCTGMYFTNVQSERPLLVKWAIAVLSRFEHINVGETNLSRGLLMNPLLFIGDKKFRDGKNLKPTCYVAVKET